MSPQVIIPAIIAGFASGIGAGGIFAMGAFVSTLVLGAASYALQKSASSPDFSSRAEGFTQTIRQAAATRRIIYGKTRVGGTLIFVESTNGDDYLHMIVAVAGHEVEGIDEIYFNDEIAFDASGAALGAYNGFATVSKALGTADQTAHASAITDCPSWTADHRLRGIANIHVSLKYDRTVFKTGIPNISCIVRGKNSCYDPRDGNHKYTTNPALCVADYKADAKYGLGATYGSEIHLDSLIGAANTCDEAVDLNPSGTESRFTCNGVIETSVSPKENIQALLSAMAGLDVYSGGVWHIQPGVYQTPTISFDESDLRDGFNVQTRVSRTETCNSVKGVYVSPKNQYQPADFPAVTNSTYLSEDNNEAIWRDLDLPFTTSSATAQRLSKIELEKSRQPMTIKYPCKLTALKCRAGNVVYLNNIRLGWVDKPFEVVEWQFSINNENALGIDLALRETASTVFSWNSGEETIVDDAPNTNLPDVFTLSPPESLVLTEVEQLGYGGFNSSVIRATFDPSPSSAVTGYRGDLYKDDGIGGWDFIRSSESPSTLLVFDYTEPDSTYKVEVRAKSDWATSDAIEDTIIILAADGSGISATLRLVCDGVARAGVKVYICNGSVEVTTDVDGYFDYECGVVGENTGVTETGEVFIWTIAP